MFCPSSKTCPVTRTPSVTSSSRLRLFSSVVLPQPDGPMITVICCAGISTLMSRRAWCLP